MNTSYFLEYSCIVLAITALLYRRVNTLILVLAAKMKMKWRVMTMATPLFEVLLLYFLLYVRCGEKMDIFKSCKISVTLDIICIFRGKSRKKVWR